jgi:hypothetical protein
MAKKREWLSFWCPIGVGILVCGAVLIWPDLGPELMEFGAVIIAASLIYQIFEVIPSILGGGIIGSLIWAVLHFGFIKHTAPRDYQTENIISYWGGVGGQSVIVGSPNSLKGPPESKLVVNGRLLKELGEKGYKLVGICFHYTGVVDILDASGFSKSSVYDIANADQSIMITWTPQFLDELIERGETPTEYFLFALPPSVLPDQFSTARQALGRGAIVLGRRVGPP